LLALPTANGCRPASRPATGSVTLAWEHPTENEDGTTLTDLAGYRVYWGRSPNPPYPNSIDLPASQTSYVVGGLADGDWYFVVTARNGRSAESPFSNQLHARIASGVAAPRAVSE
jgi:hypothetical protein